jgi:alcohol dehydrogenase class IV
MEGIVQDFNVNLPVRIVFGLGQLKGIGQIAKDFGSKAFVTIDPYLEGSGVADEVRSYLAKSGLAVVSFSTIKPNPVCFDVDQGAALCKEHGCDVVVAVGGGSAIDTAKAVAILAVNRGQSWNYIARTDREVLRPETALPLVAVPTTAGTGAEVTLYSVISNPQVKEKGCIHTPLIFPKVAIVDPALMASMPAKLTAMTGIDALSHSVESFINVHATPYSDLVARESIRLVARFLPEAVANGSNLKARSKMAWAAALGGIAISHAGTTLPHALGQPVSGLVDAPHGGSICACLAKVLQFSYTSNFEKFAALAEAFDESIRDLPLRTRAEKSGELAQRLFRDIDCEIGFRDFGMKDEFIDKATEVAVQGYSFDLDNHPRKVTAEEIKWLYQQCM